MSWENALTVTVKAGDMVIMPLRLVHAAHVWKPRDRDRRMIFYTFAPQDVMASEGGSITNAIPEAESADSFIASRLEAMSEHYALIRRVAHITLRRRQGERAPSILQ